RFLQEPRRRAAVGVDGVPCHRRRPHAPRGECVTSSPRNIMTAMATKDLLIAELDAEVNATRRALERVPTGKDDFAPHPKSMPLGRLAPHVAQLGGFGLTILTTPSLDFATAKFTPLKLESGAQLVRAFDEGIG